MPKAISIMAIIRVFIMSLRFSFSSKRFLQDSAALNDPDQNHDNGNHQQDVNKPAHRVTAHQSQEPQNNQYNGNRVQHLILLPGYSGSLPASAPAPAGSDPRMFGLSCA